MVSELDHSGLHMDKEKSQVYEFWNKFSCGEQMYLHGTDEKAKYINQFIIRYQLEPYILSFADFAAGRGKRVLEIGVGLGADHQRWAESDCELFGIDLTGRAITNTTRRFEIFGLSSKLLKADAENLPFNSESFDIVYSWGVIHCTPDTEKAIAEIWRVLKPGGEAKIMIYHKHSFVGYMLWIRYALFRLKPFTSLKEIYSKYLESPGTKAFTIREAYEMFKEFSPLSIDTVITHGDLLTSKAGQRHEGLLLQIARKIWPRRLIRYWFPKNGLFMLIQAQKRYYTLQRN
jgi:ubiquinone/menaquinone biosynthesis C-methylase UbiE